MLIIVFLVLGEIQDAGAVRVEMKSGRVFEGEVVGERDRYIRLKTADGKVYKILKSHITDDSRAVLEGKNADAVLDIHNLPEAEHGLEDWKRWREENRRFLNKMSVNQRHFYQLILQNARDVDTVMKMKLQDREEMQAAKSSMRKIRLFEDRMLNLFSSDALLMAYKDKLLEAYEVEARAVQAWLFFDVYNYHLHHKRALERCLAATEILLAAHRYMGAPSRTISELDRSIQNQKKVLQEKYY